MCKVWYQRRKREPKKAMAPAMPLDAPSPLAPLEAAVVVVAAAGVVSAAVGAATITVVPTGVVDAEEEVTLGALIAKRTDFARTVLRSVASCTKASWNPVPSVHPPLGGLAGAVVNFETTSAARIWSSARLGFAGLVKTAVKFRGSVELVVQVIVF